MITGVQLQSVYWSQKEKDNGELGTIGVNNMKILGAGCSCDVDR